MDHFGFWILGAGSPLGAAVGFWIDVASRTDSPKVMVNELSPHAQVWGEFIHHIRLIPRSFGQGSVIAPVPIQNPKSKIQNAVIR